MTLISEKEVAERLGASLSTVRKLRQQDATFPPAIKITNDLIRYDRDALAAWIATRAETKSAKG